MKRINSISLSCKRKPTADGGRLVSVRKDDLRLKRIFAASPDAIIVADLKGDIVDCNDVALKTYGFKCKRELIGRNSIDFIAARERRSAEKDFRKLFKRGIMRNREYTLLDSNGREYPAEISGSIVRDASGRPESVVAFFKDITERKKAKEALSDSEKRYRNVVDNIAIGVSVISPNMEILALNKQMKNWFPNADVSKKPVCYATFNDPARDDICSYCPTRKTLTDGKTHEAITSTPTGGKIINFRVVSSPIKNDKGKTIAAIEMVDDVTERIRMEREIKRYSKHLESLVDERTRKLSESEEHFRSVVDCASEAIVTINDQANIVFWNKAAEKTFGYSKAEAIGRSIKLIVPKKLQKDGLQHILQKVATRSSDEISKPFEIVGTRKEGDDFPMELSFSIWRTGERYFWTGIIRDVTERKDMEKALRSSEEKLRSLFENVPDGIYRSSSDGRILAANPALAEMLGYDSVDELFKLDIGNDLYVSKEDRDMWQKELEQKGQLRNAELVLKCKNGQKLVVLENAHVMRDENGKVLYHEGTLTDITERKMLEERLSALNTYSSRLNTAKSSDEVYELTLDALEKSLGFKHTSFELLYKARLCIASERGYGTKLSHPGLPLDGSKRGIVVKAARLRTPVLVPDVRRDEDYVEGFAGVKSELAVPMIAEDEVLGVLNVESEELDGFDQNDVMLLMILASHSATALNNIARRDELEVRSAQQAMLMKSSAEMINSMDLRERLQAILDAIMALGWRRVVLSVRDEDLNIVKKEDIVTAGLKEKEVEYLWSNTQPGRVWQGRFGPSFDRFKLGEFYYLPWSDPWVRKHFSDGTVSSHLKPEEMVDWHPEDLLYAPLRLADGRIVGVVSIDDPVDGRRPTRESLMPLELFLHQAAVAIENARLIEQLDNARKQIREYADELEINVQERTKQLVEAQGKLLKTERLVAIGELAGMIGHDLRNPLTSIAGATYYLGSKYGGKLGSRGKEMLQIIEKDIDYSNKIINDLLEYSREIKLELTLTTPRGLVHEILSHLKVPRKVTIVDESEDGPKFKVDVKRMRRVFTNIIKNAFDAMPKGGTLTISSMTEEERVVFSFSDSGMGMSRDTLQKLWTPLFTTKAKGMGFGLPICKRFVDGHGGRITVESEVGKGSTFTVALPLEPNVEFEEAKVWVNLPESVAATAQET